MFGFRKGTGLSASSSSRRAIRRRRSRIQVARDSPAISAASLNPAFSSAVSRNWNMSDLMDRFGLLGFLLMPGNVLTMYEQNNSKALICTDNVTTIGDIKKNPEPVQQALGEEQSAASAECSLGELHSTARNRSSNGRFCDGECTQARATAPSSAHALRGE